MASNTVKEKLRSYHQTWNLSLTFHILQKKNAVKYMDYNTLIHIHYLPFITFLLYNMCYLVLSRYNLLNNSDNKLLVQNSNKAKSQISVNLVPKFSGQQNKAFHLWTHAFISYTLANAWNNRLGLNKNNTPYLYRN